MQEIILKVIILIIFFYHFMYTDDTFSEQFLPEISGPAAERRLAFRSRLGHGALSLYVPSVYRLTSVTTVTIVALVGVKHPPFFPGRSLDN